MSIRADICQTLGKHSQNALYWKSLQKRHSVERSETDKDPNNHQTKIMYGQKFGRRFAKPLRIERNRNGQKKNQSSTMLEDWDDEEYKGILKKKTGKTYGSRDAV